ncbi:MAG: peptidoglycan-associated lipoprotein Pal [Panacagrimonas sp.]
MHKQLFVVALVASTMVLGACAGKSKKNAGARPAATAGTGINTGAVGDSGTGGSALGSGGAAGGAYGDDTSGLDLSQRTIYFQLDSSDLTSAGQEIVARFGKFLIANPTARVRLEGHADERGTREYNVGLGERRANNVQAALLAIGASANQISVVSYGEERPAVEGHDEYAWTKNRRVEIVQL